MQAGTENLMTQPLVVKGGDCYAHLATEQIAERFGVGIDAPADQPWRMRDFVRFGPSGARWRIAQHSVWLSSKPPFKRGSSRISLKSNSS